MGKESIYLPLIGITMGDPAGIGPEIIIKAFSDSRIFDLCRPIVFGDEKILNRELKHAKTPFTLLPLDSIKEASFRPGTIAINPVSSLDPDRTVYGKPDKKTGAAMADYIKAAVSSALAGEINAVVTAPINKKSLQDAGCVFPGHTEMLAHLTQTKEVVMMLAGSTLRVVLVTIHCALKDVAPGLDPDRILHTIAVTNSNLKNISQLKNPVLQLHH